MTIVAMAAGDQADDSRTRGERAGCTHFRILDDCAAVDGHTDLRCSMKIEVGRGLPALHMLAPAVDMRFELSLKAEVGETVRIYFGVGGPCWRRQPPWAWRDQASG